VILNVSVQIKPMKFLTSAVRARHSQHIARVCWALAATSGLLSFALLVFVPDVSVLCQPDGKNFLYVNRQVDLPTGDEAVFHDYSLLPLCGAIAGCAAFYLLTGAFFWGRYANNVPEATAV
jgi:hypothetical protein